MKIAIKREQCPTLFEALPVGSYLHEVNLRAAAKRYLLAVAVILCVSVAVEAQTVSFYTYETECLGVELDGSQTLRVWADGRNKADAGEQCRKNAVRDVLFKGIRAGKPGCDTKPLVTEANAQEKYADYFNLFFKDGGDYKEYVTSEDEKRRSKVKQKNKLGMKYGVVVRVLRSELKARLIRDGVIKQ